MEEMKVFFQDVIDKDEVFLLLEKPNKAKYYWTVFLAIFFSFIWTPFMFIGLFISEDVGENAVWIVLVCLVSAFLLTLLIALPLSAVAYKKAYYAVTNKRIIIRHGIIGIDYRIMELRALGATIVRVGLLDKLLGKNTGTVRFGSPSAQISTVQGSYSNYSFSAIVKPYDVSRLIREAADKASGKPAVN